MVLLHDTLFFIFRYIPFWSIPLGIIFFQFGMIYWTKEVHWVAKVLFAGCAVCVLFLVYYIFAGSPERSAQWLDDAFRAI